MRSHRGLAVAAICVVAAGVYAWMRLSVGQDYHASFAQMCVAAEMQPQDLDCRLTEAAVVSITLGAGLLVGLSLALPGVILAASGRRWAAIVPVAITGTASAIGALSALNGTVEGLFSVAVSDALLGPNVLSFWVRYPVLAVITDGALVSTPALAIAFVLRPTRRQERVPLPRHAVVTAALAILGGVAAIRIAWPTGTDFFVDPQTDSWISTGLMACFAALLGTDRRWWPWSLVPVAVLLSQGPSTALLASPWATTFSWFGGVVPLLVAGLLASLWRPLAERLAGRSAPRRSERVPGSRALVRPIVVLNAIGASLVMISVVAKATDPLPIQLSTNLPTYLGARELAQDVRAQRNLDLAISAMNSYREQHDSYAGFDAAAGESGAPELDWSDQPTDAPLVVSVTGASDSLARIVVRSLSGDAFCLQATAPRGAATSGSGSSIAAAVASCASEPWTADATRFLDIDAFCRGVGAQGGLAICRSVQRLMRETLSTPTVT